jgi:hypothetical protein
MMQNMDVIYAKSRILANLVKRWRLVKPHLYFLTFPALQFAQNLVENLPGQFIF